MSYFDHARCLACGAQFDPETVVPRGDGFACPACGAQMGLKDLFGLKAAFDEDEAPAVTLDDAVPGFGRPPAAPPPPAAARSGETALDVLRSLKKGR